MANRIALRFSLGAFGGALVLFADKYTNVFETPNLNLDVPRDGQHLRLPLEWGGDIDDPAVSMQVSIAARDEGIAGAKLALELGEPVVVGLHWGDDARLHTAVLTPADHGQLLPGLMSISHGDSATQAEARVGTYVKTINIGGRDFNFYQSKDGLTPVEGDVVSAAVELGDHTITSFPVTITPLGVGIEGPNNIATTNSVDKTRMQLIGASELKRLAEKLPIAGVHIEQVEDGYVAVGIGMLITGSQVSAAPVVLVPSGRPDLVPTTLQSLNETTGHTSNHDHIEKQDEHHLVVGGVGYDFYIGDEVAVEKDQRVKAGVTVGGIDYQSDTIANGLTLDAETGLTGPGR